MVSAAIMPIEIAFTRIVGTAAEIVDGVTLRRLRDGITVSATGLANAPVVNSSGLWVWLAEPGRTATAITVSSLTGAFDAASDTPVALPGCCRIKLAPTPRYRFGPGATALRGKLVEQTGSAILGTASTRPVAAASVRLQWLADNGWNDAPLASWSDGSGDFAAALRLTAAAEPLTAADGTVSVRLKIARGTTTRMSKPLALRPGAVGSAGGVAGKPIIWDQLLPDA